MKWTCLRSANRVVHVCTPILHDLSVFFAQDACKDFACAHRKNTLKRIGVISLAHRNVSPSIDCKYPCIRQNMTNKIQKNSPEKLAFYLLSGCDYNFENNNKLALPAFSYILLCLRAVNSYTNTMVSQNHIQSRLPFRKRSV